MATSAMTDTEGYLADVPQEHVFWCCDGRILRNLRELCDALGAVGKPIHRVHTAGSVGASTAISASEEACGIGRW